MTEQPDPRRVAERARELSPEELAAGSDDPIRQAEAILADSDERTEHPDADHAHADPDADHPHAGDADAE